MSSKGGGSATVLKARVLRFGGTSVGAATASVDGESGQGGKVEGVKGEDEKENIGKGRGGGTGAWDQTP